MYIRELFSDVEPGPIEAPTKQTANETELFNARVKELIDASHEALKTVDPLIKRLKAALSKRDDEPTKQFTAEWDEAIRKLDVVKTLIGPSKPSAKAKLIEGLKLLQSTLDSQEALDSIVRGLQPPIQKIKEYLSDLKQKIDKVKTASLEELAQRKEWEDENDSYCTLLVQIEDAIRKIEWNIHKKQLKLVTQQVSDIHTAFLSLQENVDRHKANLASARALFLEGAKTDIQNLIRSHKEITLPKISEINLLVATELDRLRKLADEHGPQASELQFKEILFCNGDFENKNREKVSETLTEISSNIAVEIKFLDDSWENFKVFSATVLAKADKLASGVITKEGNLRGAFYDAKGLLGANTIYFPAPNYEVVKVVSIN